MSVIFVGGTPGKGKTLFVTYLMRKKYFYENKLLNRLLKRSRYVNIFSNYPIRFEKGVYSYKLSIFDLNKFSKMIPDCDLVIDEFSNFLDSLEYKNFPKTLRLVLKTHRHASIHDIYIIDQHPSRIPKQAKVLVNEYYYIKKFFKIPLTGIAFISYVIYYNLEDYGKATNVEKDKVTYEFKKQLRFFKYKRVFKSYDTKYMKVLYENEQPIRTEMYSDLVMSKEDVINSFKI